LEMHMTLFAFGTKPPLFHKLSKLGAGIKH
jgi:hypothetical protein